MTALYLVDSHVLIWAALDSPRLSSKYSAILNGANTCFVSVASIWEMEIKLQLEKLDVPKSFPEQLCRGPYDLLQISEAHALAAARLPRHHGDPFDRMLIAQAQAEGLAILTADRRFTAYDVEVV